MADILPVSTWHWFAFAGLVVALLTLDLLVFHRHDHKPTLRESAGWTVFWITAHFLNGAARFAELGVPIWEEE